jgi:hypothetical protein
MNRVSILRQSYDGNIFRTHLKVRHKILTTFSRDDRLEQMQCWNFITIYVQVTTASIYL